MLGRADAVGPALAGHGPPDDVRDHRGRDARVVVDDLRLGRARLGVEHLLEVRQTQASPADAHKLVVPGHGTILPRTGRSLRALCLATQRGQA